jgi:hypothetical protein
MDSTDADAFMAYMTGCPDSISLAFPVPLTSFSRYSMIDESGSQLSVGAQTAINTLQTWCMTLKQLLLVQQQELLSNQQRFERQQPRQQKESKQLQLLRISHPGQVVQGLHPDDDQDSTISQLMQALPHKLPSLGHVHDYMSIDEENNEFECIQQGGNEEFEPDAGDFVEDIGTA